LVPYVKTKKENVMRKKTNEKSYFYMREDSPEINADACCGTAMLEESDVLEYLERGYRIFEMPVPGMVEITKAAVKMETKVVT
jgi:hypothetical protein